MNEVVVIVDDDESDRFFAVRRLRSALPDCEIKEFDYAKDALSYLRSPERNSVKLILVDINMPRMDGFEFASAFNELYPEIKGNARLYIISGSINPADEDRAKAHPAVQGFLTKPIRKDAVAEICR